MDVDGQRVSTHELGTFTTFSQRIYYDTYDISGALWANTTTHAIGLSYFIVLSTPILLFPLAMTHVPPISIHI
jgi:hypothetical protein